MAASSRRYVDPPDGLTGRVRERCGDLPDADEEAAWAGTRWRVRNRTFAHVIGVESDDGERSNVLVFRAPEEDIEVYRNAGHPFFVLGWGRSAIGLVLDDDTDWDEVGQLAVESFCVQAPKKLAALVAPREDPSG